MLENDMCRRPMKECLKSKLDARADKQDRTWEEKS